MAGKDSYRYKCKSALADWGGSQERRMLEHLAHETVIVPDQDAALQCYTEKLGIAKRMDQPCGEGARWVTVSPPEQHDLEIILHRPAIGSGSPRQAAVDCWMTLAGKAPMHSIAVADCQATFAAYGDPSLRAQPSASE